MQSDTSWLMIYRPVRLVFNVIHWDKAGETSGQHIAEAEIADVGADDVALLVTPDGVPIRLPVTALFPVRTGGVGVEGQTYIGGHELIRNFHPAADEPRTVSRWLNRDEVERLLNE